MKGFNWHHKRAYRIHCELELNLRIKPKRRIKRDKPDTLSVPKACPSGNPHIQFIGFLRHGALFVKENDHGASSTKRSRRLAQFI